MSDIYIYGPAGARGPAGPAGAAAVGIGRAVRAVRAARRRARGPGAYAAIPAGRSVTIPTWARGWPPSGRRRPLGPSPCC